jgi:oligopeptide/dipeptide ABC transporter ATP-binding protein
MRVGDIIAEPLEVRGGLSSREIRSRVGEALELVGLKPAQAARFPHEFSGGQRQRIAIARAIGTSARLIVLDEPVSALDVSIRAQIMTLLEDLQRQLGVAYLFIGHDLATVTHISHRIAVMYLGKIVEEAPADELSATPLHPYTRALFAAALPADPDDQDETLVVSGSVPSALKPPSGCYFHPRCPFAMPRCAEERPELIPVNGDARRVACHLY